MANPINQKPGVANAFCRDLPGQGSEAHVVDAVAEDDEVIAKTTAYSAVRLILLINFRFTDVFGQAINFNKFNPWTRVKIPPL